MRTRPSILVLLAALTLLAGCRAHSSAAAGGTAHPGGPAASGAAPAAAPTVRVTPIDLCTLLPEADVKAATGLPVNGSIAQPRNSNSFVCTYFFGPVALERLQFDAVFTFNDGGLDSVDRAGFDASQQSQHGQPVDGVGQAAFWADNGESLSVWTGAGVFTISVQDRLNQPGAPQAADPKAAAVRLAQEVVPKLPHG